MRFWRFVIVLLCSLTVARSTEDSAIHNLERQRKNALAEIEMTNKLLEQTKANTQNLVEPPQSDLSADPFPSEGHPVCLRRR